MPSHSYLSGHPIICPRPKQEPNRSPQKLQAGPFVLPKRSKSTAGRPSRIPEDLKTRKVATYRIQQAETPETTNIETTSAKFQPAAGPVPQTIAVHTHAPSLAPRPILSPSMFLMYRDAKRTQEIHTHTFRCTYSARGRDYQKAISSTMIAHAWPLAQPQTHPSPSKSLFLMNNTGQHNNNERGHTCTTSQMLYHTPSDGDSEKDTQQAEKRANTYR